MKMIQKIFTSVYIMVTTLIVYGRLNKTPKEKMLKIRNGTNQKESTSSNKMIPEMMRPARAKKQK